MTEAAGTFSIENTFRALDAIRAPNLLDTLQLFRESTAALAAPLRGLRLLMYGWSGAGFPGGDGAREALARLPELGIETTYTFEGDPELRDKLSRPYDVGIISNTRIGALMAAPAELWMAPRVRALSFWDLRPGSVAAPLVGRIDHVFISYSGRWRDPKGGVYTPEQWEGILGAQVDYCPQGAPLREPGIEPDAPRVLFVGDLANGTYHLGRTAICNALGAVVVNAKGRPGRLAVEARMPALYPSSRYVLSMSPRAPGYTSVRTYSILACGGLMLLHRFPDCEKLFTDGEHCIIFDSADEARERLAALDDDELERKRIAENGRRLHAQKHTVAHRILTMCRRMAGAEETFPGWL
jgi:hypothetical protein